MLTVAPADLPLTYKTFESLMRQISSTPGEILTPQSSELSLGLGSHHRIDFRNKALFDSTIAVSPLAQQAGQIHRCHFVGRCRHFAPRWILPDPGLWRHCSEYPSPGSGGGSSSVSCMTGSLARRPGASTGTDNSS